MRSLGTWRLLAGVGLSFSSWSCSSLAPDEATIVTESEGIRGGVAESGFPAVGLVLGRIGNENSLCSGSLIAPRWVLTAAHCGTVSTFSTRNKNYRAEAQYTRNDLSLVRLTTAVVGVTPLPVEAGIGLIAGQRCTAVGFGRDDAGRTGSKRSCTEIVDWAGTWLIGVHRDTGIVDRGDSGGPLLCNGRIAGTAWTVGSYDPSNVTATYMRVDWPWIQSLAGLNSCGNAVVEAGEQCDYAAQPSGCAAGDACASTCTCFTPPPVEPCEITCSPGDDMLCGDVQGCNLFCYSSAWTPDPACPAIGCSDRMCSGQVVVHTSPPTPPPPPAPGPYQGSCSLGYVDCDQYGWGTGCRWGSEPDYSTCF